MNDSVCNVDIQQFCPNNMVAAKMNVDTVSGLIKAFRDVRRELHESKESPEIVNGCMEKALADTPNIEAKMTPQEEIDRLFVGSQPVDVDLLEEPQGGIQIKARQYGTRGAND